MDLSDEPLLYPDFKYHWTSMWQTSSYWSNQGSVLDHIVQSRSIFIFQHLFSHIRWYMLVTSTISIQQDIKQEMRQGKSLSLISFP